MLSDVRVDKSFIICVEHCIFVPFLLDIALSCLSVLALLLLITLNTPVFFSNKTDLLDIAIKIKCKMYKLLVIST